ncbi:acetylornithine carbamoyltransferase, partial [Gammaproteobacteria bacterium]|nr:acetylornithine carbamoyltransferase [Gammaproteobacteria bacterium]
YGNPEDEKLIRDRYKHFIVNEEKMAMTNNAKFSHCLPLRRNIKATDGVMDSDYCVAKHLFQDEGLLQVLLIAGCQAQS